ncbi:F-box only protein 43-like [Tubulanus polymorphus]|uniref:F-box only protein 43-like n=1 Tax=Tubulanus polymorphus TaxID=672921 RepID=UPI003DA3BD94
MSSGEKCGHNMERIPIDGCSDSKTSEPSKSTSSVSAVKKCYLRYASKCGVSLESTSKGRHQFAKTPGDVSTCNSSNSCHPKTPADVAVRLSFEDVLRMHSPRDPANLIGRKMGVDRVDVVAELDVRNVVGCLRAILAGLDGADLCRMAAVSRTWRRVCLNDSTANKRRVDHLNELNAKHAELGKENYGSSMKKKLNRSPSKTVKDSLNRKALAYRIIQPTVDPSMPAGIAGLQSPTKTCSRYQLYMQEASKLKVDETLKKCPRCLCPSLMKPAEERGCCTRDSCRYDYCVRCLCTYHGAEPCRLSSVVTAAKTPTKSTGGTRAVGTKKSKKNLRRL